MNSKITIALVGNPNSGKTTVLNALTDGRHKTGNWPGVTVDKKSGFFTVADQSVEVVDLPGTYSLSSSTEHTAIDEAIACDFVLARQADIFLNVIDASNFERNLYLTTQLLDLGVPVIVVLNMIDVADRRGFKFKLEQMREQFACPVVAISAQKKIGIDELKQTIVEFSQCCPLPKLQVVYPDLMNRAVVDLMTALSTSEQCEEHALRFLSLRLLENDHRVKYLLTGTIKTKVLAWQEKIESELEECDILIADSRYQLSHQITTDWLVKPKQKSIGVSRIVDKVVLNRFLGLPIFFAVMYLMFLFAINIGGAFQDFFDISTDAIFVQGFANLLHNLHFPVWSIAVLASGVGKGINTTVTFIPVIAGMFLFLSFLEASGYMARAAFVMDRAMRAVGLPGKSFVPMIVGLGCNVPAIMGARTIENKRDRILTILMAPFMSCSARLAIFAVFVAAFFPRGGQNIVFLLYLCGILMAVLTGFILRKTLLTGKPSPFIMELPPYHLPGGRVLMKSTWVRLKQFVFRAGKVIIPVCLLIGALNAVTLDGAMSSDAANQHSLLSYLGRMLTPIFSPMGIHDNNWPATVGLLTGMLAKEVVIATLNTLYSQVGHFAEHAAAFHFWPSIKEAMMSVPHNLAAVPEALMNPVVASAPDGGVSRGVYGLMGQRFDGQIGAFAYLLFVLLYVPCVSSAAAISRELHKGWAWFSVVWSVLLAYIVAVLFYQVATIMRHPLSSSLWILGLIIFSALGCKALGYYAHRQERRYKKINIPVVGA